MNMRQTIRLGIIFLLLLTGCSREPTPPAAVKGVLDLSAWNFEQNGPVRLDGQWAFFFKQFLAPDDFAGMAPIEPPSHINLPGLWQGQAQKQIHGQTPLPPKGYATYRLRVINIAWEGGLVALYISDVLSVGKVWINGSFVISGGEVGIKKEKEHPRRHTLVSRFSPQGPDLDIILQVSNFHNVQGGINTPIWLGSDPDIQDMLNRKWIVTAVLASVLLIIGLSHLVLFCIRRNALVNLYFGLFCSLWAVQVLFGVNGGCLGEFLLPWLPWHWSINLAMIPGALTLPLVVMFYHDLFPHASAVRINRISQVLGSLFLVYLILSPPNAFDRVVLWYFMVTLVGFAYLFVRFIIDLLNREPGVRFLIPGFFLLGFTFVNDMLNDLHLIHTGSLIAYGSLGFIISYSVLISTRFSRAFASVEELTQKLKLQNIELSKLNRFKDELLANTSHELKTPLNGIMGIAQSIKEEPLSQKALKGLILIESSGKRLLSLINDLLDFSQLKKRDLALSIGLVNLRPVVDSVLMVSEPLIQNRPIQLENRIPEEFPLLTCDEDRLHQILFNLVGNGIKFTRKGRVLVGASIQGQMARIHIKDTGIGIDQQHLDRIFQSFEQVDQGADRCYPGTGLGLAITRDLVELNKGKIGVKSDMGKGSEFWFSIPLALEGKTGRVFPTDRSRNPELKNVPESGFFLPPLILENPVSGNQPLIMAVDDDPINLQVLVNHLEACDMRVTACLEGPEALGLLAQGPLPDLILLDVMMPGMTGYEVCHEIRQSHSPSELPVILVTAKSRIQDLVEGFSSGANDYLTKPFEKKELLARVKTQIHLKQSYETLRENIALKKEIKAREKRELELKLTQRRLSGMLNTLEDAVLAVNPGREIGFCNRAFEALTGFGPADLLGSSFLTLFPSKKDPGLEQLKACLDKPALSPEPLYHQGISLKGSKNRILTMDITLSLLAVEGEEFWFMFFRHSAQGRGNRVSIDRSARFIENLNLNRDRLTKLETTLQCLTSSAWEERPDISEGIKAIDRLLDELARQNENYFGDETPHDLTVVVMNLTMDYWVANTKTSRVELAEQSGLWTVYIGKDGWARTQTLDKYLSKTTLPSRPRWKNVVNTAEFVLTACRGHSPLRKDLEKALARLRQIL